MNDEEYQQYIDYGRTLSNEKLVNWVLGLIDATHKTADRTTSGNIAHHTATIKWGCNKLYGGVKAISERLQ